MDLARHCCVHGGERDQQQLLARVQSGLRTIRFPAEPQGPALELGVPLEKALYEQVRILGCALIPCSSNRLQLPCSKSEACPVLIQSCRASESLNATVCSRLH